eukprot:m.200202 g.200202  ORF g.200202 m.200202 type:complete len:136 (-) comp14957_c0_seq4:1296-1703(-)
MQGKQVYFVFQGVGVHQLHQVVERVDRRLRLGRVSSAAAVVLVDFFRRPLVCLGTSVALSTGCPTTPLKSAIAFTASRLIESAVVATKWPGGLNMMALLKISMTCRSNSRVVLISPFLTRCSSVARSIGYLTYSK